MGTHHGIVHVCFTFLSNFSITLTSLNVGIVPSKIVLAVPMLLYTFRWGLSAKSNQNCQLLQIIYFSKFLFFLEQWTERENLECESSNEGGLELHVFFTVPSSSKKIHCKNPSYWCRTWSFTGWRTNRVKFISPRS